MSEPDPQAGIYIHVPFCQSKCRYCDFYSITQLDRITDYSAALLEEMAMFGAGFPKADTLYFGGGTPSLLPVHLLANIIERAADYWGLQADAEITLEMNPATSKPDELKILKGLGINRLNIGVQSFFQDNLSFLGRIHSPIQAEKVVASARQAGFNNLGMDMIFGLPDQTVSHWEKELRRAVDINPDHLSCYILSYEPGTPLFESLHSNQFSRLDDQIIVEQFQLTHALLTASGYEHYEISNYAKRGLHSRHNCKYWNHTSYLGLGPAAHSYQHPLRWWNPNSLDRYLENIQLGQHPIEKGERLTETEQLMEALFLGLRHWDGIDLDRIKERFPHQFSEEFRIYARQLTQQGLMVMENQQCCLTIEGMLQSDHIIGQLIDKIK